MESKTLAALAAHLADAKKGEDIVVFEVGDRFRVTDYMVLITAQNRVHTRALFNELHVRLKAMGEHHKPVEGADLSWWIVLDFSDVVVHLMQPDARAFYELDRLYGDCETLDWRAVELPEGAEESEGRTAEV